MLNFFDRAPALRAVLTFLGRLTVLADTLIHEIGHALVQLPFGTPLPSIKVLDLTGNAETRTSSPILLSIFPSWVAAPFVWLFRMLTLLSGYSASMLLGLLLLSAGLGREFTFHPLWSVVIASAAVAALLMSTPLFGVGLPFAVVSTITFIVCLTVESDDAVTFSGEHFGILLLCGAAVLLLLCARSVLTFLVTFGFIAVCFLLFCLSAVIPFSWVLVLVGCVFIVVGGVTLLRESVDTFLDPSRENDFSIATDEFGGHRLLWVAVFYVGFAVILFNLIPALMTP